VKKNTSIFPPKIYTLFAILIFLGSIWIRMEDITDLPLDFHPTRQLFSALKARGIYYQNAPNIPKWQRDMAVHQWKLQATIEPEFVERLAVFAYNKAGEASLALPRIFSAIFWVTGGIFLFFTTKRLVSPDGALLTASIYLYLPYGVFASRSFQPDPLMVMLIAAFIWASAGWEDERNWKFAIFAGLFGGLAILVKMITVFFVAGGTVVVVLRAKSLKEAFKDAQIWTIAILALLPIALYFFYGIVLDGFLTQQFGGRFFPAMLIQPSFYLRWGLKLDAVVGYALIALSIIGTLIFPKKKNGILHGLWLGYIFYGLYFNYHFSTHDYYQIPFIIIVALAIAPLGEIISKTLRSRVSTSFFPRLILLFAWTLALLGAAWTVRSHMRAVDYRPLAESYREIGDILRDEGSVVALSKDYGYRLNYWGWLNTTHFPSAGDLWYQEKRGDPQSFAQVFDKHTKNRVFFLVTDFEEWEKQVELREYLLANYSLYADGENYLIFSLSE
jgi:4-amino-4-deoxy-L-arabinose transferase-like glycosyltransferase